MELGLNVEMEISGRSFAIWYYMEPGGLWWTNVLNSALPPQRHRPHSRAEHQDPVSHMAQKKREKEERKKRKKERKKEKKERKRKQERKKERRREREREGRRNKGNEIIKIKHINNY